MPISLNCHLSDFQWQRLAIVEVIARSSMNNTCKAHFSRKLFLLLFDWHYRLCERRSSHSPVYTMAFSRVHNGVTAYRLCGILWLKLVFFCRLSSRSHYAMILGDRNEMNIISNKRFTHSHRHIRTHTSYTHTHTDQAHTHWRLSRHKIKRSARSWLLLLYL